MRWAGRGTHQGRIMNVEYVKFSGEARVARASLVRPKAAGWLCHLTLLAASAMLPAMTALLPTGSGMVSPLRIEANRGMRRGISNYSRCQMRR